MVIVNIITTIIPVTGICMCGNMVLDGCCLRIVGCGVFLIVCPLTEEIVVVSAHDRIVIGVAMLVVILIVGIVAVGDVANNVFPLRFGNVF